MFSFTNPLTATITFGLLAAKQWDIVQQPEGNGWVTSGSAEIGVFTAKTAKHTDIHATIGVLYVQC